ncbi:MAG TPA: cytochrome P450 [Nonomuraea sp.]|nr:cytochrome P450 [Nonomuraea sp.]
MPPAIREYWRQAPVREVATSNGGRAWLVTGMAEVRTVLSDPRFSRAEARRLRAGTDRAAVFDRPGLHDLDPPEHTRLRRLVQSAFSARRMRELRPRIEQITGELLARLRDAGPPADLNAALCFPLPVAVICEILGVPQRDRERFRGWSRLITSTDAYPREQARAAREALTGYIAELVADKYRCPDGSLLHDLITARDQHGRLGQEDVVRLGFGLLIAAYEATANMLGKGLVAMLDHPDQVAALRADLSSVPAAVEEVLRYVVLSIERDEGLILATTCAVELGGVTIPAHAVVLASGAGANLDPTAFAESDRFDLKRADADSHVAFGYGPHYCLGAQLARMELEVAYTGLLREFPGLRLAVPAGELSYTSGMLIHGLRALPVTWDA